MTADYKCTAFPVASVAIRTFQSVSTETLPDNSVILTAQIVGDLVSDPMPAEQAFAIEALINAPKVNHRIA